MAITIHIPTPLRPYVGNKDEVELSQGGSISQVFQTLVTDYADLKKHLYDNKEQLRKFVNVYLNDEDIRDLEEGDTEVEDGDVISIIPSIAGGL